MVKLEERIIHLVTVFACLVFISGNVHAAQMPFIDIGGESPFFTAVDFLKTKNFISGYTDGTFQPQRKVNRAEALAMIFKVVGITPSGSDEVAFQAAAGEKVRIKLPRKTDVSIHNTATGEMRHLQAVKEVEVEVDAGVLKVKKPLKRKIKKLFRDVVSTDWFFETVREAKARHIVSGIAGSDFFEPNATVTLAEALRMLFTSTGTETSASSFESLPPGVSATDWFAGDIIYALSRSIITQKADGTIASPAKKFNRGEFALLLYRFLKTKDKVQFGYASWYGDGLAKTKLTSGLEYAEKFLTAAHRTLPFGTVVRVTNMENGKSVEAVINDRGPFVTGRVIDLSKTAFSALESPSVGVISVQVEMKN